MGVWNDWGYGITFFRALSFRISEPEIWQNIGLSGEFRGFPWKLWPIHTPTKCRPIFYPQQRGLDGPVIRNANRGDSRELILVAKNLNTIHFCSSNFSGAPEIPRQNPGISRQESLISLVSRDIPNFLAPTPSCGRPLPHRKVSALFSCLRFAQLDSQQIKALIHNVRAVRVNCLESAIQMFQCLETRFAQRRFSSGTQGAAKGGTQKGVGHFFLFRSPLVTVLSLFLTLLVTFFAYPLLPPPFAAG